MNSKVTQTHLTTVQLNKLDKRVRGHLINSLSGFKPANLVGTISNTGETNLSIISSVFHLGADPALMGLIIRPDVSPRHTLTNLRENKSVTINHVTEELIARAHQTSARYPRETSEFHACDITEEYLDDHKAPFVKEARVKIGLKMLSERLLEENNTHFIVCKINHIYFESNLWDKAGPLDLNQAGSVAISGLDTYHSLKKIARYSYAKPDKPLDKI